MTVNISRFTPGLKNGKGVAFAKGEKVRYRMRNGTEYDITIKSEYMSHGSGYFGYEAKFPDGEIGFAPDIGIVGWKGRVE
jgi:hypothetical protein